MPCDSSYMQANGLEIEVSRMMMLIEELEGGKHPNVSSRWWRGYHPNVYGKPHQEVRLLADQCAKQLCASLRGKLPTQIKDMSLEMQLWWREHQKADKKRGDA